MERTGGGSSAGDNLVGDNDSLLSTIEINVHSVYSCMHVTVEHVANGVDEETRGRF